jgi:hypothetical protein
VTNSEAVHEAARESWGCYGQEFEREPVELRVTVQDSGDPAREPVFHRQEHLLAIVSGPGNFATLDLNKLFGACVVSPATVAERDWFRWFFLDPMAYILLAQRHVVPTHGACVARNGRGVMLSGASGAGKSTLAFACARAGWTYISDDATCLLQGAEAVTALGRPYHVHLREDAPRLFPELENCVRRVRPNGKMSLELPLGTFPWLHAARHSGIACLVFLERQAGGAPACQPMPPEDAAAALLAEMPFYGDAVWARHEAEVRRLVQVPCYRLRYQATDDAIRMLAALVNEP